MVSTCWATGGLVPTLHHHHPISLFLAQTPCCSRIQALWQGSTSQSSLSDHSTDPHQVCSAPLTNALSPAVFCPLDLHVALWGTGLPLGQPQSKDGTMILVSLKFCYCFSTCFVSALTRMCCNPR